MIVQSIICWGLYSKPPTQIPDQNHVGTEITHDHEY